MTSLGFLFLSWDLKGAEIQHKQWEIKNYKNGWEGEGSKEQGVICQNSLFFSSVIQHFI